MENKITAEYELSTRYDLRKSFYGKAKILECGDDKYLLSYYTIVAGIRNGELFINGWYSQTTARHIKEFILQSTMLLPVKVHKITKQKMENYNNKYYCRLGNGVIEAE